MEVKLKYVEALLMLIFSIVCFLLQYGPWNIFWHKIIFYRSSHRRCSMKKGALVNFTKFTGKHLFFIKVAGLRAATLLKKKLRHRFFPVNFVKFLRTPLDDCVWFYCGVFFIFSIIKNFASKKVASCEKSRLVENRLKRSL